MKGQIPRKSQVIKTISIRTIKSEKKKNITCKKKTELVINETSHSKA